MAYFLQQLINGVTLGSIYGLIAIGYTMVYGIIGMINFAHGEIYMIGAFISVICFTILGAVGVTWLPLALLLVLVVTMLFTSLYGWTVERVAYRALRGSHRLAALISAIGMSLAGIVLALLSAVFNNRAMSPLEFVTGAAIIFPLAYQDSNLSVMTGVLVPLAICLWFYFRFGLTVGTSPPEPD